MIDYTANGNELAAVSGGPKGNVTLWNTSDARRPRLLSPIDPPATFGPVAAVGAFSPNGRLLVVGNARADARLYTVNGHTASPVSPVLKGATPYIEQLNFSPNMQLMLVGDDAGHLHMWDIADPASPMSLPTIDPSGETSNIFGVADSPNGKLVATAAADDKVWLWSIADLHHPRLQAKLGGFASYAYTVAFTPNGRTLIAGSADDTIRLWNVSDPHHPHLLHRLTGPTSTVYQVAVSPNGSTLAASTTGQQVWLWNISDPASPREEVLLTAATGEIFDVTFSPNGRTMVAGGTGQKMTFWNYHPAQVVTSICARAGSPITKTE